MVNLNGELNGEQKLQVIRCLHTAINKTNVYCSDSSPSQLMIMNEDILPNFFHIVTNENDSALAISALSLYLEFQSLFTQNPLSSNAKKH